MEIGRCFARRRRWWEWSGRTTSPRRRGAERNGQSKGGPVTGAAFQGERSIDDAGALLDVHQTKPGRSGVAGVEAGALVGYREADAVGRGAESHFGAIYVSVLEDV